MGNLDGNNLMNTPKAHSLGVKPKSTAMPSSPGPGSDLPDSYPELHVSSDKDMSLPDKPFNAMVKLHPTSHTQDLKTGSHRHSFEVHSIQHIPDNDPESKPASPRASLEKAARKASGSSLSTIGGGSPA